MRPMCDAMTKLASSPLYENDFFELANKMEIMTFELHNDLV